MSGELYKNDLKTIITLLKKYNLLYSEITSDNEKHIIVLEEKNNFSIKNREKLDDRKKNLENLIYLFEEQGAQVINRHSYKDEISEIYEMFFNKEYYTFILMRN